MERIEEVGMTDLQFKSWVRQFVRELEGVKGETTKEGMERRLEALLADLREDLQG